MRLLDRMKGKKPGKNEFFDIKPLKDWGIIWFPISMSNITTKQSVKKCLKWIDFFGEKIGEPKIGLNTVYTDFLYFNSNEKSSKLKEKFMFQIVAHKNGLKKEIYKRRKFLQIQHAFHIETWGNLYIGVKGDFGEYFRNLKKIYKKDKLMQKYIRQDCKFFNKKLTKYQIDFFLEENLMTYLVLSMQADFRNEYVQGREKWILLAYPGLPLKAQAYLFKLNPFKFKIKNPYFGVYNLLTRKLYDFNNIDLETWNYN